MNSPLMISNTYVPYGYGHGTPSAGPIECGNSVSGDSTGGTPVLIGNVAGYAHLYRFVVPADIGLRAVNLSTCGSLYDTYLQVHGVSPAMPSLSPDTPARFRPPCCTCSI